MDIQLLEAEVGTRAAYPPWTPERECELVLCSDCCPCEDCSHIRADRREECAEVDARAGYYGTFRDAYSGAVS